MIKDTEAIAIYVLQEARISPSMEWCVDNSCLQKKKKRPAEESVVSTAVDSWILQDYPQDFAANL